MTLHKALKDAVSDALIPRNAASVRAPRPDKPEIHPLSPDQARKLIATVQETASKPSTFSPTSGTNLLDRHFKPLLKSAELPPIRFHDLRHTCATILLMAGRHPKHVHEHLGHASISITLDTYSHVIEGTDGGLAEARDDAL